MKKKRELRCPHCGAKNLDQAQFCTFCGAFQEGVLQRAAPFDARTNLLATAALVLGILSVFFGFLIALPAIVCGIVALVEISNSKERAVCGANLKVLGRAVTIYRKEFHERYPTAEKWCTILTEMEGVSRQRFQCPSENEDTCCYAMNQQLIHQIKAVSDPALVVLFESNLGWNGVGGPENLVMRHEMLGRMGCNILFADGHVEFVIDRRMDELKWQP